MIKSIFEWIIITWSTLLVLLISGWILNEFYRWEIEIIAAVIAFVGAIIGGMITWIGVSLTIKSNQSIELERIKKDELMYLYPLKRELEKIAEHIYFEVNENHISMEDVIIHLYKEFSFESKMYDYAQRGSGALYIKLHRFKDSIDSLMDEIFQSGYFYRGNDREFFEYIQKKLGSMNKDIEKEINLRTKNN